MTPTQFKKGGDGQTIRFAVNECSLGWVAVAATQRGVCSVEFGDDAEELTERLARQFSRATLLKGDAEFLSWVSQIVRFVDSPHDGLDLPLDVQGTAFQRKVWEQVRAVPAGSTATYSEIAQRIGQPNAARAVASAIAANNLAVAVPCHRILRKDGSLSGYRWGIERKRQLIDREFNRDE